MLVTISRQTVFTVGPSAVEIVTINAAVGERSLVEAFS